MAFAIAPPHLYPSRTSGEASRGGLAGVSKGTAGETVAVFRATPSTISADGLGGQPPAAPEGPFVSDIFDEVDEEVRRERFTKFWERYGNLVIALAVLVVVGVGAWRGYEYWRNKQAEQFGAQFTAAMALADQGKHAEAEKAFAAIADKGTTGYRALARLREAAEIEQRDPKAAIAAYDDLAKDSSVGQPLQDFAALRAGMLMVDSAPLAEVDQRLAPLATGAGPFRHSARELLAVAAWKAGDIAAMRKWIKMVNDDPETPLALRQRVDILTAITPEGPKG